jgi:hypothetical protein
MIFRGEMSRRSFPLNHERERLPVELVAAGAIGIGELYNGKVLPVLIINTINRPDIDEMIRIHEHTGPGDVKTAWAKGNTKRELRLILMFERPVKCIVIIDFNIEKWGILIDHILYTKAVYIQSGDANTKISEDVQAAKIVVEVPDTGFGRYWAKVYHMSVVKNLRALGASRSQAKAAADQYIRVWQEARDSPADLIALLKNVG